ncbi:unnamed protein product [Hydatigera taeniaeformis]|uniref:leucine--tRNA ligase n=1 Tax=Hydatigena taeniaeformis TaxID=6205 RepID=A0A0R3X143_HYDTA|nr:unnamed protein product [Hydatigera taeniaeformis]
MGHLRVYVVGDVLARYYQLLGNQVIFPMGWDAFGLPAENAAIDRGVLPEEWTRKNIQNMRKQLKNDMKLSFDWTREIATCNPDYYRWTQWLFIKLFKAGLAYRRLGEVNWDPVDKTVLANELVDAEGRSWRSGALSLKDGLGEIKGQQWRDVIQMQEGWIGPNDGFVVEFDLDFHSTDKDLQGERLAVFTKQPGLVAAGAISFVAVGPQSIFWNERFRFPQNKCGANGSRKLVVTSMGSFLGKLSVEPAASCNPWPERLNISAKHFLTTTSIPLIYDPQLRPKVEYEAAIELGTPAICERHRELSRFLDLPPPECQIDTNRLRETDTELQITVRQSPLSEVNCGVSALDHLQTVPVPEEDLPVELPLLEAPLKRGDVPLKENIEWRCTTCPSCGNPAEREVDTLDTFVDSSWYYLRFLDPANSREICSRDNAHKHIPVDIYIGGVEHAIRHLFYARFIAHFLHRELGLLPCREPFRRFLPVGLVMGRTFKSSTTGQYLSVKEIERDSSGIARMKATGEVVVESWEKMSKSKLNGVDPSEVFSRHGVELTRLTMLASTGPHAARQWNEDEILRGVKNWQSRIWRLIGQLIEFSNKSSTLWPSADQTDYLATDGDFLQTYAHIIEQVHHHYGESFVLSSVIANLQKLTNILLKHSREGERCMSSRTYLKAMADLIVMLHPLAPLFSCELWRGFSLALCSAPPEALNYLYAAPDWCYHLVSIPSLSWVPNQASSSSDLGPLR